jgi:phosphoribosylglycinamide formyltransferase 1
MLNIHPLCCRSIVVCTPIAGRWKQGDTEAGCTVHEVTADLDDGPILGQARVPILPGDTAETLAARVLPMEHRLYPAVLRRFASGDRRPIFLC